MIWAEAYHQRRCVFPVSSYFEWSGQQGCKRTHEFSNPEGGWLWIAGIWEENRVLGRCFSMITTAANSQVERIHNRMPGILEEANLSEYLAGASFEWLPYPGSISIKDSSNPLVSSQKTNQLDLF